MNIIASTLKKTVLGLPRGFYLKNFIFGLAISFCYAAFFIYVASSYKDGSHNYFFYVMISIVLVMMSVAYPFSLFLLMQFKNGVGKHFGLSGGGNHLGLFFKLYIGFFTMLFSYSLSIFIAPVCITYLYFYNTSNEGKMIDA
jgi:hypothetical protein